MTIIFAKQRDTTVQAGGMVLPPIADDSASSPSFAEAWEEVVTQEKAFRAFLATRETVADEEAAEDEERVRSEAASAAYEKLAQAPAITERERAIRAAMALVMDGVDGLRDAALSDCMRLAPELAEYPGITVTKPASAPSSNDTMPSTSRLAAQAADCLYRMNAMTAGANDIYAAWEGTKGMSQLSRVDNADDLTALIGFVIDDFNEILDSLKTSQEHVAALKKNTRAPSNAVPHSNAIAQEFIAETIQHYDMDYEVKLAKRIDRNLERCLIFAAKMSGPQPLFVREFLRHAQKHSEEASRESAEATYIAKGWDDEGNLIEKKPSGKTKA
jgi:hypothetical protein|tara:strand:+ start:28285 stop:29274 length:990 start_codon:yes stop_codon:yes gene_type:complete